VTNPEAGAALIVTLMLATLLAFLGGALVFIMDVETAISANHRLAQQLRDAAESGVECAIAELGRLPDWSAVPGGTVAAALDCLDAGPAATPDGTPLDLARLTSGLQARSDGRYGSAPANSDSPRWVVFSRGGVGAPPAPYVVVWVADDVDDRDGRPEHDENGVLMLKARAFGRRHAQAGVEVLVARAAGEGTRPSDVRLLGWRRWR
jgi:hypothetical protein